MSLELSLEEQELLADTFQRVRSRMSARERAAEIVVGGGFAAAATVLLWLQPPHTFELAPAGLCLLMLVLATRVRFDTPFGCTAATQLAFVPLLFATPVAIVPLTVPVALAIGRIPDVVAGKIRPSRLVEAVGNSWFAIGPVAVFALANTEPGNAGPALLLGALAAQFLFDFAASTLRFWIDRGASFAAQLRESWVYAIDAALSVIALAAAEDITSTPVAALAPLPMLALLAVFAHERHHRLQSLLELNDAYRGTALVLGDVVEADDSYTSEHCKSVVALALAVGEQLKLTAEQRRNLEFGALLHDVGKIAIPKAIINKPGRLDPQEWTIIKTHTVTGQKMLDRVGGFMRSVGLIVRSHHERWDGAGYPDGLTGEAIPLEARIIACCDTWNAMRTDRPYRRRLSHDIALAELEANAGSQFDPRVVDALVKVIQPTAQHDAAAPETTKSRPHMQPTTDSIVRPLRP